MAEEKDTAAPAKRTAGKTGRRKKPEAEHAARAAPQDKDTGSKAQELLEQARTEPKPEWEVAEQVVLLPLDRLRPFKNHPFKVNDEDELMQDTIDSIMAGGVINPILVRPAEDGKFEVVSGHRRFRASELAGKADITFSHPRQKRNIRMRSLPEEYREDAIREVLAGRRIHNPRKRRSPLAEQKAQLVSSLEAKQNQGRGHYYDLSIQNQITKQQAKALLYYQQHGFTSADDFEAFAESVEAVKQRRDALASQITSAEKRLNEIAVLQKHITNYLKTKDIYAGYRASGYSKVYYEEHEDAIKLCKASKRAFDELLPSDPSGKTAGSHKKQLPSLKALRAEYAELLAMKKAAYPEYYRAKDEYRELLTYQANLAGLFGIENVRSAPQREHQQEEK